MTLTKAMLTLKEKGVTYLTGEDGDCGIDTRISTASRNEQQDNYFIVELEGHYVIASTYGRG